MTRLLDRRTLNRATLARQGLLERVPRSDGAVLDVVTHLAGLQGQDPEPPYVMLWDRIEGFEPADLQDRLDDRTLVRAALYRSTQHLLPAADHRWVQPLLRPMLERQHRSAWKAEREGVDLDELVALTRATLAGRTIERPALQQVLAERWPDHDPLALARLVQGHVAMVHPPPDGSWRRHGPSQLALADDWLGAPGPDDDAPGSEDEAAERLARRYLAGFGPASVKDLQAWSGLTRQKATLERLRPELEVFEDEHGIELFDLPDAPRPVADDVDVPVRFLALLDNVTLGYVDRTRVVPDHLRPRVGWEATFLVDGEVRGFWKVVKDEDRRVLDIEVDSPLSKAEQVELEAEGERLLAFLEPEAEHDLRLWATGDPR